MKQYINSFIFLITLALLVSAFLQKQPISWAETDSVTDDAQYLDVVAQDTWNYLSSDWATDNHLPWSWRSETLAGGGFANTAEIGLYALSWVAAYDLQRPWSPTWEQTETEVIAILDQLRAWQDGSQTEQPHGSNAYNNSVFYQWYWITWNPPVVSGTTQDHLVPSIDNAWLAVSLITIQEYAESHAHSEIAQKASDILADMDFRLWYHADTSRFTWGDVENPQGGFEADYYSNENRIINFVARALGHLSMEEYQSSLDALEQPEGTYNGIVVDKISWDGSYFTYGSPALFIREMDTAYGLETITPDVQAQIAYAQDQGYDAWGLSDCFDVGDGDYVQQGAPPAAMPGLPETRHGLVTPHASILGLMTPLSGDVISNTQAISNTFSCAYNSDYGFRDSIMTKPDDPDYGQCSVRYSSLAQEWIFLAIINYESDFIHHYFYQNTGVELAHQEMFLREKVFLPLISN